jgi:HPt (histidine-containing phosphotransfer) domain-containing protein
MDSYVAKPIQARELFEAIEGLASLARPEVPEGRPTDAGFDPSAALSRVGGDAGLLKELAEMFVRECPGWMAEVRTALTQGDAVRVRRAAHTLKGAVGTFAAQAALEAALRLEALGRAGDLAGAEGAWSALEEAVRDLTPALAAFAEAGVATGQERP